MNIRRSYFLGLMVVVLCGAVGGSIAPAAAHANGVAPTAWLYFAGSGGPFHATQSTFLPLVDVGDDLRSGQQVALE